MMPDRSIGSPHAAPAWLALIVLVAAGLIGCGHPTPKPAREAQTPRTIATAPTVHASTYVVIRLQARRLELMRDDVTTPLESFPIAVGRAGKETPTGRFEVEEMVEYPDFLKIDPQDPSRVLKRIPPGPENPLGERWIGFAHGEGWSWTVGIHGTPNPELLGSAVSGGCIRMRNADVIRVYGMVRLGTPVVVHP